MVVEGGRLPLGILEGVSASSCKVVLEPGDVIVMASDGVMDAVSEQELEEALVRFSRKPPQMLAEALVSHAQQLAAPDRRDDMTALCARITLRQTEFGSNCCRA